MTDTPEPPEEEGSDGMAMEPYSESDYVEVEGAMIIAPRGWGWMADTFDAAAIRVNMAKGGNIDILTSQDEGQTWKWLDVTKLKAPGKLVAINGDKQK